MSKSSEAAHEARVDDLGGMWLDHKLGDGYWASLNISYARGRPEVKEVRIRPTPGAGKLSQRLLRRVRLTGWEDALPENEPRRKSTLRGIAPAEIVRGELRKSERMHGDDLQLQRSIAASAYVQAHADGHRNALVVAAEDLGETPQWTRDQVFGARQSGLLTETKQGRQGGALTSEATHFLDAFSEKMATAFGRTKGMKAWLRDRAEEEGVDPSKMTHGEWKAWAKDRFDAPDVPFR